MAGPHPTALPWLIQAIKQHDSDYCLLWPFGKDKDGYGRVRFQGEKLRVPRVAFFIANGYWANPCVCHTCDVPACFNPLHLFEGSNADNTHDALRKSRMRWLRGESNTEAKLTGAEVIKIRTEYGKGATQQSIAHEYGVSQSLIGSIVRRESWNHL